MPSRVIAIGDIHGCASEFEDLLELLGPTTGDQLILLGDILNRGPNTPRVFDLARSAGALCLQGNHERRLLNYRRTKKLSLLKKEDYETLSGLRACDWEYLEAMPLFLELPEKGLLFVHAGFVPSKPWRDQGAEVLTQIQVIDQRGRPRKRAECGNGNNCDCCQSWADLWRGPPFVVYGHTPRDEVYKSPWAIGIDTACVSGGSLTAYIATEKRFLQVAAKRRYFQRRG